MSGADHLPPGFQRLRGKTLRDVWATYREMAVPAAASAEQVEATRFAFYAGAASLRDLVFAGMSEGADSTPEDEALMQTLFDEIDSFAAEQTARLKEKAR